MLRQFIVPVRQTTQRAGLATPPLFGVQKCYVNMNRSVQTRWEIDSQTASQKRTEYDFDKEQWMKQMRFASMDCIMDPDITPIRYTSVAGVKKAFRRFVTMRKLMDRRPDFDPVQLKELFIHFKTLSHEKSPDCFKTLQRITTHGEADRILKEIKGRMNEDFAKKSWRSLKQQGAKSTYEMEVDSFDLVTCYMGQMSQEDWLQITYRCEFRQRESKEYDWETMMEYPVFEVRLGDGVKAPNTHPFIVVGVLKKDGTRYGKDSQDAADLRKQFDRTGRWF
ncbi:conserved hypothetical protein [Leishmania major strain Friedlin]|uniref:Uncharacterized protein n=1 Tax=Leishmania major TaxID=5664 RepID=Q4QFX7_LEIMA|nr:conserved hypothetical protein [Leishmania major strain Friedlin]CAG9571190.1 hypothetical_protein_-_conserved [Leishmania major strain Friedlin]CAJ02583.1 conserved hypothetical protein [Leishmania major strain Friedlin]|eukprot:XP_001687607.1 conserved hypothetical protein [Leishmania major strain Friedlin]